MELGRSASNDAREVVLAVAFLLDRSATTLVDMENRWGNTHDGYLQGSRGCRRALLERGADVNRKSEGRKGLDSLTLRCGARQAEMRGVTIIEGRGSVDEG